MNIIYIHTHDSGRVLEPYGYSVETPNLLEFCKDAVLFKQAYSVAPTCSPSRAGFLTGMYPHSCGMLGLAQRGFELNDYSKHMVQFFKSNTYHTVLCGIQHEAGSYLDSKTGAKIIGYHEDISCNNEKYKEEELYKWDLENAEAISRWLQHWSSNKSFFLSYGLFSTHRKYPKIKKGEDQDLFYNSPPYPTIDNSTSREDFARYKKSAFYFDQGFAKVINALKKNGIYDNSIIIYTTDHGLAVPFSKGTLFDTGIGVSLVIRVPNSKMQGKIVDHLVSHIDVFPTLCELLELKAPEHLQGESFAQVFNDSNISVREEIFAESNFHTSYEPIRCIRNKNYKYIRYFDEGYLNINVSNIDSSELKSYYVENGLLNKKKQKEYLFDLIYDPMERNNLVDSIEHIGILNGMRQKLEEYQQKTKDPLLKGSIKIKSNWKVNKSESINPSSKAVFDYVSFPEEK